MRQFIRQFIIFSFMACLLASCRGGIPLISSKRSIDRSAFRVSDADMAEGTKTEVGQAIVPFEMVRVGFLLPLTGSSAKLGESLRNSALMSLFDIGSPRLVLQFYDTEGTVEGARKAAETAISQGSELIIGPVFSHAVRAIRPITHKADVGVITFSSHPSNLGDGVYTISTLTSQQVEHITQFACDKGYRRLAVLSQDNATGDIISLAAKSAIEGCGGSLTKAAFYDPRTDNPQPAVHSIMPRLVEDLEKEREEEVKMLEKHKAQAVVGQPFMMKNEETGEMEEVTMTLEQLQATIDTLKEKEIIRDPFEFDAVLISEEGSRLRSMAALMSYYDVPPEIRILGTSQWADSRPAREPALIGGWFSNLPSAGFNVFSNRYRDIFGEKPPRIASQAYDAVALAAVLAETGNFSHANLTTPSGFKGIDGLFRLLPNGLSERGLEVLGVEKKGFVTLSPALEAFESAPVYAPEVYIDGFRNSEELLTPVPEEVVPVTEEGAETIVVEGEAMPTLEDAQPSAVSEPVTSSTSPDYQSPF